MRTRSSSNLVGESSPNPTTSNSKRRNRRRSKQPFILEEPPLDMMADQRTMAELLRAPTEGYAEAIVVPPILAEHFKLNHSLINMMTSNQFFGLEKDNPHDHIRWFNKITSTIKFKDVPNSAIKLMLFPFSLAGAACRWLKKEPPRSILTCEDIVFKFINEFFPPSRTTNLQNEISNFQQWFDESFHEAWDRYKNLLRACPHHGFTELHQLDTFYNALNPADQDSLNSAVGGNLLERRTQDVLTIIENKSKVRNSQNKSIVSQVKSSDANSSSSSEIAKLTHAVNQQTSDVTTAMTAILKQFQTTPPPASIKSVEGICVTCSGAHPYYQGDLTDPELAEYTIKVPPRPVQKAKPPSLRNYVVHQRDPFHPHIPYPSKMNQEKQQEKDEIHVHKFKKMFKQLHINITLADALILIWKYQKMLKALLSNKEKLLELANTPLNENCSAVILKKLPEKLGDPGKFLISYGFSELKFKALADLANRAICTPTEIARDVFVPVGKFTFLADFVIVDYESDPRVPLILGRPLLQTAHALINVHGEEIILRDCDERLTLNMRHDTSSYSNQPHKESINMINIYNDSYEDYLEDLFAINHLSGNLTFSSHTDLTSPEVINLLSGNTTSSTLDHLLEEFADELVLITFPPGNDDIDECNLADPNNNFVDTIPEMFTDKHTLDYSYPPLYDDVDDDLVELESDNDDVYDDPFDSKEDKIKESKLFIDELDPPRSSDFLPSSEYDSVLYEDFSKVDDLPSTNNEAKVFNPRILIHENLFEVTIRVTPDKSVKKIYISNASLILEDFNPPLYELPFHKEVTGSETLLSFSSENEEKVFNPGILTSKGVHTSLLSKLSHRGPKAFKVIKFFESLMEIFPCSYGEDIRILDVPCLHFYPS
nr:reverse transcriptase domain-containing protein [Tanacetum cinerariifolium]